MKSNKFGDLFKLLLGGLIIYIVYKHLIKKKINLDDIPVIGDLKNKLGL